MIGAEIRARAWQIGTVAGAALALTLGVFLMVAHLRIGDLTRERDALADRIDNPQTGYVVRLAQCRTNVDELQTGLDTQNAALAAAEQDGRRRLAAAEQALAAVRADNRRLSDRAAIVLNRTPQGADACERTQDVIRDYQERLQ